MSVIRHVERRVTAVNGYKAIFFDLDGTLLPMDVEAFLKGYFESLAAHAAKCGMDPMALVKAVKKSVAAMADHEPGMLNSEAFWSSFEREWGSRGPEVEGFFDSFYEEAFGSIGTGFDANPAAAHAIGVLAEKGYPLYLTTMPLFPRIAVEWRLRWAGVDPSAFQVITTFDNSTTVKPHLGYYQENVERSGFKAEEILMVGNNTEEDMVALKLGMDGYLVTDFIIDPIDFDIDSVKHGSLEDFARFAESLPACEGE